MKDYIIIGALIVIVLILLSKTTSYASTLSVSDKGDIVVYGSKTCPWCVKQEAYLKDHGIPYNFVDCKTGGCPDFVKSFPTIVINGGDPKVGYTEI